LIKKQTDKILKKYVCKNPFMHLDAQNDMFGSGTAGEFVCCPSWCPTNIEKKNGTGWYSETAQDIRKSMLDGTYRHCDDEICPELNYLLKNRELPLFGSPFVSKEEFTKKYKIESEKDLLNFDKGPEEVIFSWDRSCNFRCPSCRSSLVANDDINSPEYQRKLEILERIENNLAKDIKRIVITGSGDPFYSRLYREFLINFDKTKYPKLKDIQLVTNGKMLTEDMWNSLKAAPYVKRIEISIDAGTKNTYENVTRLGGDWDQLISNLKFISTLGTVKYFILSMVVSKLNYTEMFIFYNTIIKIFNKSKAHFIINFRRHVWWHTGLYSKQEVQNLGVFKKDHPENSLFIEELKKIDGKSCVSHNFHDLL
jgi:pyruvate-formate lyase-activating enzyme